MRPHPGTRPALLALALGLAALAMPAHAAVRAALDGWPLARAEGEGLLTPALRSPRDSTALRAGLLAISGRMQEGGWLDAAVSGQWEMGADAVLRVRVRPGVRYRWGALQLDTPHADSALFAGLLAVRAGGTASPGELAGDITGAVDAAEARGYAWASLGVSGWSADSGRVRVRLTGALGPRVDIADVRLDGLLVTRPDVATRAMGRLVGLPYNPVTARAATQRLEQLGVFRRVEYLGIAGASDWRQGVLHWRVSESRANSFEGAVGVQGGAGAVGLAHLELGNLLGSARQMGLSWQASGAGRSEFAARYVEPMLFGRALRWEGELRQQIQDSTFTRFVWGTRARIAFGLHQHAEAGFDEERVVQPHQLVRDADAQNTTFALERDTRDDVRTPREGSRARVEATQIHEHQTLVAVAGVAGATQDASGSAVQFEGEWHRRTGRPSGLSLEWHAAGRFSSQRVLQAWERWPVGGVASLRGHDEGEYRVDRYALTRLEWRWFLGPLGQRVALFWDHAQMQTREPLDAGGDRLVAGAADGVGVGLRLPAAGGDVDVDYGLAPGRGFLEGKIHLRLVTAF